jgi:hypothetical protein
MKKNTKKVLVALLSATCLTAGAFAVSACGNSETDTRDQDIVAIYNLYVANAEENKETPKSYDEWLASIKGEDGTDGADGKGISSVTSDDVTGGKKYTITYTDNTTYSFTVLNGTNGSDGNDGSNGKSAYQIAKEAGATAATEAEWVASLQGAAGTGISEVSVDTTTTVGTTVYTVTYTDGKSSTITVSNGANGKSAYELAVANGTTTAATEAAWLAELKGAQGDSAYQVWVSQQVSANAGTVAESYSYESYLAAIKGEDGVSVTSIDVVDASAVDAATTEDITGEDSTDNYIFFKITYSGSQAATYYKVAKATNGTNGKSAYELAVANGTTEASSEEEWLVELKGEDGDSAYQVWAAAQEADADTSEEAYLAAIKGEQGDKGDKGATGSIGFYASSAEQLQAAVNVDNAYVVLLNDITVTSTITISGKNVTVDGNDKTVSASETREIFEVTGGSTQAAAVTVTFKNITIRDIDSDSANCITTEGGYLTLNIDNVKLSAEGSAYGCALVFEGDQGTANNKHSIDVNIINGSVISSITYSDGSVAEAGKTDNIKSAGYTIISYDVVNLNIDDSTIQGWSALYLRGPNTFAELGSQTFISGLPECTNTKAYGVGSSGSVINITNSTLLGYNKFSGGSDDFAIIVLDDGDSIDDNITLNIVKSTLTAISAGNAIEEIVQYNAKRGYPNYTAVKIVESTINTTSGIMTLAEGFTVENGVTEGDTAEKNNTIEITNTTINSSATNGDITFNFEQGTVNGLTISITGSKLSGAVTQGANTTVILNEGNKNTDGSDYTAEVVVESHD